VSRQTVRRHIPVRHTPVVDINNSTASGRQYRSVRQRSLPSSPLLSSTTTLNAIRFEEASHSTQYKHSSRIKRIHHFKNILHRKHAPPRYGRAARRPLWHRSCRSGSEPGLLRTDPLHSLHSSSQLQSKPSRAWMSLKVSYPC
jgi:hypothetical protein